MKCGRCGSRNHSDRGHVITLLPYIDYDPVKYNNEQREAGRTVADRTNRERRVTGTGKMTYTTKTYPIKNRPDTWNSLMVHVFADDKPIGSYVRNYSSFYQTFYPFTKDGKDYALYSRDYTATRVMALPSCDDLGGEEGASAGFCPVEYYVPTEAKGRYGFVAGCVWGDDTSWKIHFLDLREVEKGIVKRDERFGYIELPEKIALKDAISVWDEDEDLHLLSIAVTKQFRLDPLKSVLVD